MSFSEKLVNLDRRILFTIMFIVAAYFCITPIGLSVAVSPWVKDVYNGIDSLESGDIVLVFWGITPGDVEEMAGGIPAMKQLYAKDGIKMLHFASVAASPPIMKERIDWASPEKYGKEYGRDWINLGFISGGETMVAAVGSDLKGLMNVDVYGTTLESLPLWNELSGDITQFKLIVALSAGEGVDIIVRQLQTAYHVPVYWIGRAHGLGSRMMYYQAGQLSGMICGLPDVAAYEILIKSPGIGAKSTDVLSMMHITLMVFIIVGNIGYVLNKREGRVKT